MCIKLRDVYQVYELIILEVALTFFFIRETFIRN